MSDHWIADRMRRIDASGIRKVFDLAAHMHDPINLSIGQPHFDTPQPVKQALYEAVAAGKNAYSQTQGAAQLLSKIQAAVDAQYGHGDRQVFITSGTSGALNLVLSVLVNPGDDVIVFDPWFVMYKHLNTLAGGKTIEIDTYPEFRIDLDKVRDALSPRTRAIIVNSPANPTGYVATAAEMEGLAKLAAEKDIPLISDEIYKSFCYDRPFVSPAKWNDRTIVIDGFSKSHSLTGWRLGWCHGPREVIQQMLKLQQFTFVCAPHPVQHAGVVAWDYDISDRVADYKRKRDFVLSQLRDLYHIPDAGGAFYLFPRAPWGTGSEFVAEAIRNNLLVIPGNVFSPHDTHFRISYAAEDRVLERGCEVFRRLAKT